MTMSNAPKEITLPSDEASELFYGADVVVMEPYDKRRWYEIRRTIISHDNAFYEVFSYHGASELQEQDLWNDEKSVTFRKVRPRSVPCVVFEVVP